MAKQDSATECSSLLRKMDLEDSEDVDPNDAENMEEVENMINMEEVDKEALIMEDQLFNKNLKRRTKWGPTLRAPSARTVPDDGTTMLEKATTRPEECQVSRKR